MKNVFFVVLLVVGAGTFGRTEPSPAAPVSLSDFFKPGVVLLDTNDDGAIDFVNARIVLPSRPTSAEFSAAANVAARLGFETSAMDVPIDKTDPKSGASSAKPAIFIGAGLLASSGTWRPRSAAAVSERAKGWLRRSRPGPIRRSLCSGATTTG